MARLIAESPFAGLLPVTAGGCRLTEVAPGPVHSVAPLRGRSEEVSAALEAAFGLPLPGPNRTAAGRDGVRAVWSGAGQALLLGAAPPDLPGAAVADQSDAWALLCVEGAEVEAVLARLVPVDLSGGAFPEGATARTLVGHMTASVTRTGPARFEIMVFRSMARTLAHEVIAAAEGVAARAAL